MDPLQAIPMPTHGVLIGLTLINTWQTGTEDAPIYVAYIATNSTDQLSFVSLETAARPEYVLRLASRPSFLPEYRHGVVVELCLSKKLETGQAVYITVAQAGATTYFPPQPMSD